MGDQIMVTIAAAAVTRQMRDQRRRVDAATVIALRGVARLVSKEAKKVAPVYKGDDPRAVPGEYRKSIRASRRVVPRGQHTFSTTVAPRGKHPRQYATKLEERDRVMQRGKRKAEAEAIPIHAAAWEKAMQRR